jgi:hypothetical protein
VSKSNVTSRIFAWRQATAWSSNIPDLTINIYNANTNTLVLNDTVAASANGTWQYSTDGTTWNSWLASADAVGNYIRYTATALPDGIPVKAIVLQT